jgi:hypothetical protein
MVLFSGPISVPFGPVARQEIDPLFSISEFGRPLKGFGTVGLGI